MLLVEVLLIIVFIALGFRITYAPKFDSNWNAIGAVGQWAGAFVGLLIPIAAIYIQYKLDKNREQIGKSNTDLLTELQNFKDTYEGKLKVLSEMVDENGDIVIDGGYGGIEPSTILDCTGDEIEILRQGKGII